MGRTMNRERWHWKVQKHTRMMLEEAWPWVGSTWMQQIVLSALLLPLLKFCIFWLRGWNGAKYLSHTTVVVVDRSPNRTLAQLCGPTSVEKCPCLNWCELGSLGSLEKICPPRRGFLCCFQWFLDRTTVRLFLSQIALVVAVIGVIVIIIIVMVLDTDPPPSWAALPAHRGCSDHITTDQTHTEGSDHLEACKLVGHNACATAPHTLKLASQHIKVNGIQPKPPYFHLDFYFVVK